jgi:hypothetical protein
VEETIMLYAVTVEPFNAICFISERPDDNPWEVQEGVGLDAAPLFGRWTPEREPFEQILCVSTSDPYYFKVFRNQRDIDPSQFRPTGRHFGGIFSKPTWERFARLAAREGAIRDSDGDEPPGATEAAIAMIKRGG